MYGDCGKMELSESEVLCSGAPTAARDGVSSYPGSGAVPEARDAVALLGPGAPSAATNGVACTDALGATPSPAVPPGTRNAVSFTGVLTAQLGSGAAAPTPRNGVAYPDVLVEHFGSTLPPGTRSGASLAGVLKAAHLGSGLSTANLSSGMPPATWNSVAYPGPDAPSTAVNGVVCPGGLSAVTATSGNAISYAIDVHEGAAGFGFGHLHPTDVGQDGGYDVRFSGMALPFAAQAVDGTDSDVLVADAGVDQVEMAGAATERARGGLARLGLAAAALAVAGLTAGGTGTVTPGTALASFAMLIAGVTLVTVRVFRA